MAILNPNLPLGLPEGSVRGVVTIILVGASAVLWCTGQIVPQDLALLDALVIGAYFQKRASDPPAEPVLPKPFVPGEPT